MLYVLVYRYYRFCSNWNQLYIELTSLKGIFRKNGYPKEFIYKCFKKFLNIIHPVKDNAPTVTKKVLPPICFYLLFPYLRIIYFQTRTKLQQAVQGVLNCNKRFYNVKQGFPIYSVAKTLYLTTLYLYFFINFSLVYYCESIRHLDPRNI